MRTGGDDEMMVRSFGIIFRRDPAFMTSVKLLDGSTPFTPLQNIYSLALVIDMRERPRPVCSVLWLTGMSHRKWRETKHQPSKDKSGNQIVCCLVSLHFLCDIPSCATSCRVALHNIIHTT